jgi:archaeal flagellin FlaB
MKKAMMGIGTLIIFIAVILVAAIAAAVMITTGGSLQQKALITGAQSEEGVTSGLEVTSVVGSDASSTDPQGNPKHIGDFKMMTRLKPGSQSVNINTTILTIDTEYGSTTRLYGGIMETDTPTTSTEYFMVNYLKPGPNHIEGYINRGDTAYIIFRLEPEIGENEKIGIKIIPRVGHYTQIDFFTPNTMTRQNINLWPN